MLLPLALAGAASRVTLVGGTHVPWSPPFPYLADVFLPALAEVGVRADVGLARWGWYPRGGGQVEATIRPTTREALAGSVADACGARPLRGLSAVSRLPRSIEFRPIR